ncbi:MAG: phenylacetate--CoA ligase [Kiritimatiellae bacterium]|nr:phenylacetate--CoA ligase [Kiritimatiellia bacterium]
MKPTPRQLEQIDRQIRRILASGSYFAQVYREAGVTGCKSYDDFLEIPFSEKADLRHAYPLGIMVPPQEEIVRIHSSSGTTGMPVIIPYTAKDVSDWAEQFARCYRFAGITEKDRIQITPGYGLWTAGIGFQAGCERLGAMAIPMGPGNTEKQLQMMVDLQSTVITATSSYALLLAEEVEKRGLLPKLALKRGVIGSEMWGEKKREAIAEKLQIELFDIYGLTEIYGPGIGINCPGQRGMHIWDDFIFTEIVDPATGEPVEDGESGEIVLTTLVKEGAPLLRFRTHDLSRIIPETCPVCGSSHPMIDVVRGRSDDMFKVHGVNLFPSQVEDILAKVDGTGGEYRITIAHDDERKKDVMLLTVEAEGRVDFSQTTLAIQDTFKSMTGASAKVTVVPVGTLPRSEKKTKRVTDLREV